MRELATLLIALGLSGACAASVQEQRATLERAATMLGATDVKTLEYTGSGVQYQSGQSQTPGDRWPRFNVPSFTRVMSYETASMQDTVVRTQGENPPRGGGVQPIRGEQRQVFFLSAEHAWNQVVKSDHAADGVWYVTGGTHHSVVIEMADHVVLVEGPLNDQRALAVMAEARRLVPSKPIRYVIASHHHFDHSGGLRAFAGEGVTLIVHDSAAAYFERTLAAPATIDPDHLAKSGRRGRVETTGSRRTLADATRSVDIHHMRDNAHADSMLIVHLPKEQLLGRAS